MLARLGSVICGALAMSATACSTPQHPRSSDAVHNASVAIALARKACSSFNPEPAGSHWEATYSHGAWNGRQILAHDFMGCKWFNQVSIKPNGEVASICEVCIPRTDRLRDQDTR